jgi:galactokinase/mevalonate kinase-like predicted kinase
MKDPWKKNKYISKNISVNVIIEGALAMYFAFGMYSAFVVGSEGGDFGLFPFHLILFIGFSFIFSKSITNNT